MMSVSPPPTKPPRGVKTSRETSAMLMNVIRTLSTSESNEQREKEKAKLEREYKKSDQQLNELVSKHNEDLTQVMQLFGKISNSITTARDKLHGMKELLIACKTLLSCRRDELKKLWLEGAEQKHILKLLEDIELLKDVPAKLGVRLVNKEYLDASKLLVSALNIGNGALEGVEALRELKNELTHKKEKLYEILLKEISRIVYLEPTNNLNSSSKENNPIRGTSSWCKKILESTQKNGSPPSNSSRETNFENELKVLVECLALLNKIPDAVEYIRAHLQPEILRVVNRVSSAVLMRNQKTGSHPLLDLLSTLTDLLRVVASRFAVLRIAFEESSKTHNLASPGFQHHDIWCTIQSSLQLLLTEYLDIQNAANDPPQTPSYSEQMEDISSYFARRRIPRSRKLPLFKFEFSTKHSKDQPMSNLSLSSYSENKDRDKLLVCLPNPNNITIIFSPLMKFIEEIEQTVGPTLGVPCLLNSFVNDYVKEVFLGREHSRISLKIEGATKSSDAWRTPISPQMVADMNLNRPLLSSTVSVSDAISELEVLLSTLPFHRAEVMRILVSLIKGYTETCYAAYRGIVQPEPEDKRLCSVSWLKDDDISRFLKSLPNWLNLQAQKPNRAGHIYKREDTCDEECPEDVRQRNIKEAEILLRNLTEGGIGSHEIISDPQQLKSLAQLQESLEWFAWRVALISTKAKKLSPPGETGLSNYVNALNTLAAGFEELANTCLLMLHLEVRVQCFHYLLPRNRNYGRVKGISQDPDPRVLELSRVLVTIDESLTSSLQTRKIKYIFEGLGYLISKILMNATKYMDTVDEGAIHKMCRNIFTLQQTLSNITMTRDISLDHARRYFQLFFSTPEGIINEVLEKGPNYSLAEYTSVLQLIVKSQSDTNEHNSIARYLQRLGDILGEHEATV